jgi:eukaryotic-like serine/threonine-protein kinase
VSVERWKRVRAVFEAALERQANERDAFLSDTAGDDAALRREVESLLAADASDNFLDQLPVASEAVLADALAHPPAPMERALSETVLAPGLRLGPYQIGAPLGVGAMGEVYRACDTNLNRDVALKVLPERFSFNPDRLTRFTREAQVLATLNHPNIAAIYGVESSNGAQALVLELVEGPTLAERIALAPLSLDEALAIGRQIAEALEAAHEKGIIHRDVKPANIKVTAHGVVKVLDFGLARVWDGAPQAGLSGSPRLTATDIAGRTIMGTPAYMSPEQARCKPLDRRTDIWSFGCVLYEMLTGRTPFGGDTISDTIAAVLDREPDWKALPRSTPTPIRRMLRRCLEKERKLRLDSAADARLEFDEARTHPAAMLESAERGSKRVTQMAFAALAAVAIMIAFAAWALTQRAVMPAMLTSRFAIVPPVAQPLNVSGPSRDLALSPDGRHLVYRFGGTATVGSPMMVRAIDQLDAQPLANVGGANAPFISHDSQWIGFFSNGELKKVSIAGGPVITLCQFSGTPLGASWADDNTITFATTVPGGLWRVSAGGGEPAALTTPDGAQHEASHAFPSALPRGRGVLFTIATAGQADRSQVAVLDSKTGQRKTLVRGGGEGQYVETGHLVFSAAGNLRAVRFDPIRLEVLGEPVTVVERVMSKASGAANYAVSRSGTLVYMPDGAGGQARLRTLVWVDRKGHEETIDAPLRFYGPPRLSPDGTRVATGIRDDKDNTDIWIWDLARESLRRLTFAAGMDGLPVWTPDAQRIVFMSDRTGVLNLYSQAADGSGTVDRLTTSSHPQWPTSITTDGRWLVGFDLLSKETHSRIVFFPMTRSVARPESGPAPGTWFEGGFAEFSPDGRYVAYQSDASGQNEVYVRPFPNVELGRWQISTAGGTRPAWARDGRELFFLDPSNTLTGVAVRTSEPSFIYGSPAKVFDGKYVESNPARHYDVSHDGRRFLMIKDSADGDPNATPASMVVVAHWFEELKRLVPAR